MDMKEEEEYNNDDEEDFSNKIAILVYIPHHLHDDIIDIVLDTSSGNVKLKLFGESECCFGTLKPDYGKQRLKKNIRALTVKFKDGLPTVEETIKNLEFRVLANNPLTIFAHFIWKERYTTDDIVICVTDCFRRGIVDCTHKHFPEIELDVMRVFELMAILSASCKQQPQQDEIMLKTVERLAVFDIFNKKEQCFNLLAVLRYFQNRECFAKMKKETIDCILTCVKISNCETAKYSNFQDLHNFPVLVKTLSQLSYGSNASVLYILECVYPYLIKENMAMDYAYLFLQTMPLVSPQVNITVYKSFFGNVKKRHKENEDDADTLCHFLLDRVFPYEMEIILQGIECRELTYRLQDKCLNLFKNFRSDSELILKTWKSLSQSNRKALAKSLQKEIKDVMEPTIAEDISRVPDECFTCVEKLCNEHGLVADYNSKLMILKVLAPHDNDAFLHILSHMKASNVEQLSDTDTWTCIERWFKPKLDDVKQRKTIEFKDICYLYNTIGKVVKLVETKLFDRLLKQCRSCIERASVYCLVNDAVSQSIIDSTGIEIMFRELAMHIKENFGHEDRINISENVLCKLMDDQTVINSKYLRKIMFAIVEALCGDNCRNDDGIVVALMRWPCFWKLLLKQACLKTTLKEHRCIFRISEFLSCFHVNVVSFDFHSSMIQTFCNPAFADEFLHLHRFLVKEDDIETDLQKAICKTKEIKCKLKTISNILQIIHEHGKRLFPMTVVSAFANDLRTVQQLQQDMLENKITMKTLMNSEHFETHVNSQTCFEQCEKAMPFAQSHIFWNTIQVCVSEETKNVWIEKITAPKVTNNGALIVLTNFILTVGKQSCQHFWTKIQVIHKLIDNLQIRLKLDTDISQAFNDYRRHCGSTAMLDFDGTLKLPLLAEDIYLLYEMTSVITLDAMKLIETLIENKRVTNFLQRLMGDDIRNIIEAVDDYTEQNITVVIISNLIRLYQLMQPIIQNQDVSNIEHFIDNVLKLSEEGNDQIYKYIEDCKDNIYNLESLYDYLANRKESTSSKTTDIIEKGFFRYYVEAGRCKMYATYDKESQSFVLSSTELSDLRSRSLLVIGKKYTSNNKSTSNTQNPYAHFVQFIDIVDCSFQLLELCTEISNGGHYRYNEDFDILVRGDCLDSRLKLLKEEMDEWKSLIEMYQKKYFEMQFLTFGHITQIHRYLQNGENRRSVESILFYINSDTKFEVQHNEKFDPQSPKEVLDKIVSSLQMTQLPQDSQNVSSDYLPDDIRLQITNLKHDSDLVMRTIFSTNFPHPKYVLMCDFSTHWDEINQFLLRCGNAIHTDIKFYMTNVELLRLELQYKLSVEIQAYLSHSNINLHIIYCGENQPFPIQFQSQLRRASPAPTASLTNWLITNRNNMRTVTSVQPGLGKTETIRKHCSSKDLKLKYLPVNGNVNRHDLVRKLDLLDLSSNDMLHIDIGVLENPREVDRLIFQIIVLKFLASRTHSFFLSTEYVYVEIANTTDEELRKALQFTMCLQTEHLTTDRCNHFTVSKEIKSPVQVVCHYLKALETKKLHIVDLHFENDELQSLPGDECRHILNKHFKYWAENSFTLRKTYLSIMSDQLKRLSRSVFFTTTNLNSLREERDVIQNIKCNILESLIAMTRKITMRTENEKDMLRGGVSDNFQQPLIVFNSQDIDSISVLCKRIDEVPEKVRSFFNNQLSFTKNTIQELDRFCQNDLKHILWKSVTCRGHSYEAMKCIMPEYVITADNLLKMVLINLKIDARIPVIIMGETGCGKTTLLEYLAKIKQVEFRLLNIHAGLSKESIIQKIESFNEEASDLLQYRKQVLLFVDEINTSKCIGLLCDILVHRHVDGKFLKPNLTVIASCNPYRVRDKTTALTLGLKATGMLADNLSELVYRVYPLPEAMLDFVWNFGHLSDNDEKKYIQKIVNKIPDTTFESSKWNPLLANLLFESQLFMRTNERSVNCVSLREIHRSKSLFLWFMDEYFPVIRKSENEENTLRSAVMTLSLTYYSRLKSDTTRNKYWKMIAEVMEKNKIERINDQKLRDFVKNEQTIFIDQMQLPAGIAKNRALQESVFTLFVCILRRIPMCLVGKPGSSKSLSVQLLKNNMRGKASNTEFFKRLPQLYFVTYQGSNSSTPKGIEKVFKTANEYQRLNNSTDTQVVVLLDEIGLADQSRFQPLMILHSLLEPSEMKRASISVIGLSNWAMDPAKMNRLIHISCPEMSDNELIDTGEAIYCDIRSKFVNDLKSSERTILKNIAEKYYLYTEQQDYKDFHSGRDFYSLIKFISRSYNDDNGEIEESKLWQIIERGIERNLSGNPYQTNINLVKRIFIPPKYVGAEGTNTCDLIEENLEDLQSRHLMLLCNGDALIERLEMILRKKRETYTIIYGSHFEDDQFDEYSYRILSKIILCMEEGHFLVLKDLDIVYGSLYDMLNQNYTIIGKRKHCKIALGPYSNPLCHVHDQFKCIVIANQNFTKSLNTPFLSRFEKHIFTWTDFMDSQSMNTLSELKCVLKDMITFSEKENLICRYSYNLADLIPVYDEDVLSSLIQKCTHDNNGKQPTIQQCLTELLPLFQTEMMFLLEKSIFWQKHLQLAQNLLTTFFNLEIHAGLNNYIEKMEKKTQGNAQTIDDHKNESIDVEETEDEKASDFIPSQFYKKKQIIH